MSVVGYARVSSSGQSVEVQCKELQEYGCDRIYSEKVSGASFERPELNKVLDWVREGDSVVVTKLDRLGCSVKHLMDIQAQLQSKNVKLVVLDMNLDTSTAQGKLMMQMLSAIAEFELTLRRERQMAGIRHAKEKGVKFGRSAKYNSDEVTALRDDGLSMGAIAKVLGCSKGTVHRLLQES